MINWFDNIEPPGTLTYATPYFMDDFFLAAMFLRFYFILQTMIALSPPNNRLVGKRVCHEFGVENNFSF